MKDFVQVRIESPAFEAGSVLVAELTGKEQISRLFEFQLRLVTVDGLDEDALLTNPVTLVFERRPSDGNAFTELRRISGMVRSLRDRSLSESKHREYLVTIVPRVWRATLTSTSDLCMDLAIPAIIQKKLGEVGMNPAKDVVLRLKHTYAPREFVVQYQESHWDFVCRLAEDLGMHFSFEEIDGQEVIVFGDENASFTPSQPAKSPFSERGDRTDVYELEAVRELVSTNFIARDYNYRNPSMDLLGQAQIKALGQGTVDEYGTHGKTPDEITYYAKIRAEEAATRSFTFEGRSDLPGLRAGSQLTVEGHARGDIDMVVTEVTHEITQPVFGLSPAKAQSYQNTFRGVPKAVPYRPARLTPKPIVHGVVTGIVESASATKLGAIDAEGRYRVSLMYDAATDRADGKGSRPLRMAQSSAGSSRGFHAPLTIGTEVIISCVNGDPDRPIIAGAVSNPQTPSPVTSANAEKSMWKTNVNSIAIDDDQPRCKVSVSGEDHVFQLGHPNAAEFGVALATIGNSTAITNQTATKVSKWDANHPSYKTTVCWKGIVSVVGIASPMGFWKSIEEKIDKAAEYIKLMNEGVKTGQETATKFAKIAKKRADDAKVAAAGELLVAKFEARAKTPPQPSETDDQWVERAGKSNPKLKEAAEAAETTAKASEDAEKEVKAYEDGWAESKWNPDATEGGVAAQAAAQAYATFKKAMDDHFSTASEKISEVAAEAAVKVLETVQKAAGRVIAASGQRSKISAGSFEEHCAITTATNSVGLFGTENAFVGSLETAGLFGAVSAHVTGGESVHLKSDVTAEVAANTVLLSAKNKVDVHSSGTLLIVSKEKAEIQSTEDSIHIMAKKDITLLAQEESLFITAKKDLHVTAQEGKYELKAKQDILIDSTDAKLTLLSKTDARMTAQGNLDLLSKKDATLTSEGEMKLKCKSGEWKAKGDIKMKVSNFTVNGSNVKLEASKLELC